MATILSSVSLRNFRTFAIAKQVPLRPLTFVVGQNNSGKSSLLSSLMFAIQSGYPALQLSPPKWGGPLIDLGSFRDTVYGHFPSKRIAIEIEYSSRNRRGVEYPWRPATGVSFEIAQTTTSVADLAKLTVSQHSLRTPFTFTRMGRNTRHFSMTIDDDVYYYSEKDVPFRTMNTASECVRRFLSEWRDHRTLGPRAWEIFQELEHQNVQATRVVASRNSPNRWYSNESPLQRAAVTALGAVNPSTFERRSHPASSEVRAMLSALGISSAVETHQISPYHRSIIVKDKVTGIRSNLTDLGYGVSQTIPVLEALASPTDSPLFIEQPEVHLHPNAQGQLGEFISEAAQHRQVFVETHSDAIINSARIKVLEGVLRPADIAILFVTKQKNGSAVTPIMLDEQAEFTREWPDGFFDNRYKQTMAMLKLRAAPKADA